LNTGIRYNLLCFVSRLKFPEQCFFGIKSVPQKYSSGLLTDRPKRQYAEFDRDFRDLGRGSLLQTGFGGIGTFPNGLTAKPAANKTAFHSAGVMQRTIISDGIKGFLLFPKAAK
jgi:hypothetical protein